MLMLLLVIVALALYVYSAHATIGKYLDKYDENGRTKDV